MGNEEQNQGNWDQAKGDVKEGVGNLTGNEKMEYEGKWDQAKGKVEEGVGDAREAWDRYTDETRLP